MKNVKIENEIITVSEINSPTYIFKILESMPKGYGVWNIGEHMGTDEYIPCCESISAEQPYHINPNTLIAIKLPYEEILILRKAASRYGGTVRALKRALRRKNSNTEIIEQSIKILERIQNN